MNTNIKLDETNYIVGIDIGLSLIKVSYLDQITLKPVIYDISGGYNEPAIPFCLQYIKGEKEWLIGHDVIANIDQEDTYVINNIFELLINNKTILINETVYSANELLTIFLGKVINSFKQLNPRARITSLAVSVTDYYFDKLKDVIKEATDNLNINKVYINSSTLGLLYDLDMMGFLSNNKKLILFTYETEFFSHLMIDIKENHADIYNYDFNESLALNKIEENLKKELIYIYKEHMKVSNIKDIDLLNISKLLKQSFILLFQKYAKKQSMKLYYNFVFPPFQSIITYEKIKTIMTPFNKTFNEYIAKLNIENCSILLDGPGFKMFWPQKTVKDILKNDTLNVFDSISKGNCLAAAGEYVNLHKWKVEKKEDNYNKYYIAYISNKTKKQIPIDINKFTFHKFLYEQLFIIDFEENDEVKLLLVSEGEDGCNIIADEVVVERADKCNRYIRVNLKISTVNNRGLGMEVEYLPL